jgi:8-oxo-dGTP pyrophosphatase MutT (NUDIX family)
MRVDRPPPGEALNEGEATSPRPAASVILIRDAKRGGEPEVLLVKRNPAARFMGGVWVFPGGSVADSDGGPEGAAVRELHEEAGIELGEPAELVPFARWITPAEVKVRFDTWFYLAAAPAGARARVDQEECVDAAWLSPTDALEQGRSGQLHLVFPTIKQLEQLAAATSVEAALAHARAGDVEPILPRVLVEGDGARVVLPGEPGYY